MTSVSIIIPAYNEEKRLPATLSRIKKHLSKKSISAEIIVVNDGSTDGTADAARRAKVKLINNSKNRGKGYSINRGMLAAKNGIVFFTDADLSTPIDFLGRFIKEHKTGADVVIASRDIKGSKVRVPQNIFRETGGKVFNLFVRAVTGLPIHDTQCGFKSFKKEAAKKIFPRQTIFDFGFDAEILFIARKHKCRIVEYPVEWYNSPATKVDFFRDSMKMFAELFKIRLNDMKGLYK
jgi:dolichyl-phosphate beta-glucosyltransferase